MPEVTRPVKHPRERIAMPRKAQTESIADTDAAPGGVAAVDRALTLLGAFRAGDLALGLSELAERTQLYKSTVLRLLASLEHARLVQRQDDGRYSLGSEVARLHSVYAASFSLDKVVLPVLRGLVAATGESAAYHVKQGQGAQERRVCLYRVDSPHPIRDHIQAGEVLPMDRGTGARVLRAFGAADQRAPPQRDRRLLAGIRQRGYYAAVGDRLADVAGISAPVFKADGSLAGALTLTMPSTRYQEKYSSAVLEAARRLGTRIG